MFIVNNFHDDFNDDFNDVVLMFLLLNLNMSPFFSSVSIFDFEKANVSCDETDGYVELLKY